MMKKGVTMTMAAPGTSDPLTRAARGQAATQIIKYISKIRAALPAFLANLRKGTGTPFLHEPPSLKLFMPLACPQTADIPSTK